MSWSRSVFSENISSVGYDPETNELLITWIKSGKTSAYQGVPEGLADQVSRAASVQGIVNSDIKPNYPHRYV